MNDFRETESFEDAAKHAQRGIIGEFFGFMRDNMKWWLLPFLLVFALLGSLLVISGSAAAPFIYALF